MLRKGGHGLRLAFSHRKSRWRHKPGVSHDYQKADHIQNRSRLPSQLRSEEAAFRRVVDLISASRAKAFQSVTRADRAVLGGWRDDQQEARPAHCRSGDLPVRTALRARWRESAGHLTMMSGPFRERTVSFVQAERTPESGDIRLERRRRGCWPRRETARRWRAGVWLT